MMMQSARSLLRLTRLSKAGCLRRSTMQSDFSATGIGLVTSTGGAFESFTAQSY
jgi:hypothetical protein